MPFEFTNDNDKKYIEVPTKKGIQFIKYQYLDKDGKYQELPKENENKYYLSTELIKKLKTDSKNLSFIATGGKDGTYRTPVIIKAVFEEKQKDFDTKVSNQKTNLVADKKVDINNYELKIIRNNQTKEYITPNRIIYENNDNAVKYGHKHLTLEYDYDNQIYHQEIPISVNKQVVYSNLKVVKNKVTVDSSNGYSPILNQIIDSRIVDILDNYKSSYGDYKLKLKINNPNYTFKDNKNELLLDWSVDQNTQKIDASKYKDEFVNNNVIDNSLIDDYFDNYSDLNPTPITNDQDKPNKIKEEKEVKPTNNEFKIPTNSKINKPKTSASKLYVIIPVTISIVVVISVFALFIIKKVIKK